jgi:hypothetical protein
MTIWIIFRKYESRIQENPVEMILKFDGIPPFTAPMPPEEHTIKAPAILDLCAKVIIWFKKYGYELK